MEIPRPTNTLMVLLPFEEIGGFDAQKIRAKSVGYPFFSFNGLIYETDAITDHSVSVCRLEELTWGVEYLGRK